MAEKQARRFWLAIGMLVLVALTMGLSTTTLLDAADETDRDIVRVDVWNDLDTGVVEMDEAAIDYLLTAAPDARANYEGARLRLTIAAFQLRYLDNDQDDGAGLFGLLAQHRRALDNVMTSRPQHVAQDDLVAMRREHRLLVSHIRRLIAKLDDHVMTRKKERERTARAALIERIAQLAGLATSLAIVTAAFIGLRRQIRQRRQIAAELQQLNDELEQHVAQRTSQLVASNEELRKEVEERKRTSENLRSTEEQLRQSLKLDGIGRLAGGIAHDFNNLLTVILSYGDMLVEEVENPSHRSDIDEMRMAAVRASELTRQLLAFSRQQVLAPKIVDLNQIVDGMTKLLQRVIGEHLDLRVVRAAKAKVEVDPGQIEQVIMNLVVNARDAMPMGGTLTIETADVFLDEMYAAAHEGVIPGPHVMVAVTDSGLGMSPETVSRIFEPFFTTKAPGKGTGMGLPTVFGIVKQSRGSIWVYSEADKGTTFKVYIPVADDAQARTSAPLPRVSAVGGNERILLVEDDASVRKLTNAVLTRAGYTVFEAEDGQNALEVWKQRSNTIDLVLTDVVMPKMGGRALGEALRLLAPSVPVIYMSGYTDDTIVRHGIIEDTVTFLQKPVSRTALLRKVRELIDPARPAPVTTAQTGSSNDCRFS